MKCLPSHPPPKTGAATLGLFHGQWPLRPPNLRVDTAGFITFLSTMWCLVTFRISE